MIIDDTKGYELKYIFILVFQLSIDLSYNKISGEIPEELLDLGLLDLNLAGKIWLEGSLTGSVNWENWNFLISLEMNFTVLFHKVYPN